MPQTKDVPTYDFSQSYEPDTRTYKFSMKISPDGGIPFQGFIKLYFYKEGVIARWVVNMFLGCVIETPLKYRHDLIDSWRLQDDVAIPDISFVPVSQGGDGMIHVTITPSNGGSAYGYATTPNSADHCELRISGQWEALDYLIPTTFPQQPLAPSRGAPTIIGVTRSCDGSVIDYLSFSPFCLVNGYSLTMNGVTTSMQTIPAEVAGQIRTIPINPKETNIQLTTRDIFGDTYTFEIGRKATPSNKVMWATNWLYGYGGGFSWN